MSFLRREGKRARRRAFPIHAYCGPNGGGKSAAMMWDTIPSLSAGRRVLSTVRVLDFANPRLCDDPACTSADHATHLAAHPRYESLTDWKQLLDAEHCDVLMDEVTGVASSRESASMPPQVANFLVQLRRRDVVLRWTAPNWARADVVIRECSQAVTHCRGFLPKTVDVGPAEEERLWRHRRLFLWRTFDAALFDDFTTSKSEALKPWVVDWHWGPGSPAFASYDTFDSVAAIGTVSDAGRCMTCHGRRQPAPCTCPDYTPPARRRASAGAERKGLVPSTAPPVAGAVLLGVPDTSGQMVPDDVRP